MPQPRSNRDAPTPQGICDGGIGGIKAILQMA
jgi:hypothetical protein